MNSEIPPEILEAFKQELVEKTLEIFINKCPSLEGHEVLCDTDVSGSYNHPIFPADMMTILYLKVRMENCEGQLEELSSRIGLSKMNFYFPPLKSIEEAAEDLIRSGQRAVQRGLPFGEPTNYSIR